jgi:hypothetical protein
MRMSLVLVIALSGCLWRTKQVPAPPPPMKLLPADLSVTGAPADGLSRVVLDVQEGPALVENVDGATVSGTGVIGKSVSTFGGSIEYSRSLCVTPCVVDTKPGVHQLRFTLVNDPERTSTGYVNLDSDATFYRHSIGRHHSSRWKGAAGAPLVLGGIVLGITSVGRFQKINDANSDGWNSELRTSGIAYGAVGVGLVALGAWLIYGSVVEEQPGSGVQWHDTTATATR